jgi:hypothetical protein
MIPEVFTGGSGGISLRSLRAPVKWFGLKNPSIASVALDGLGWKWDLERSQKFLQEGAEVAEVGHRSPVK